MPWRWRKATWALALFNVLMLIWVLSTASTGAPRCVQGSNACVVGQNTATAAIGVVLLLGIWFVGFVVLALIWIMSRPNKRICPQCGHDVKKGRFECGRCRYSFAQKTWNAAQ